MASKSVRAVAHFRVYNPKYRQNRPFPIKSQRKIIGKGRFYVRLRVGFQILNLLVHALTLLGRAQTHSPVGVAQAQLGLTQAQFGLTQIQLDLAQV